MNIRPATIQDLDAITAIYNEAVLNSTATFDTVPKTREKQVEWFRKHEGKHPVLVATEGSKVLGWASLSEFSGRCAYAETAELSVYVDRDLRGKGTGKALMEALIKTAREWEFHTLISRIAGDNDVSFHLHEKLGFARIGTMREVGRKFGRLIDVHLYQIIL